MKDGAPGLPLPAVFDPSAAGFFDGGRGGGTVGPGLWEYLHWSPKRHLPAAKLRHSSVFVDVGGVGGVSAFM